MIYLLQVFLLVSIPIFVLTGIIVLSMIAWIEAKNYARAKMAMRRAHATVDERTLQSRPAEHLRLA